MFFSMKASLFFIAFLLLSFSAYSQSQTLTIHPNQTDAAYIANQDSHVVSIDPTQNLNKMLLFLVGTGAGTDTYVALRDFAAELGWDVIVLSYENSVAAASLSNDQDSLAFDHYRQEICYGTALSPAIAVDTLNSIKSRFLNLLNYLDANDNSRNWGQYLSAPNSIDWTKIAVGGHSQGAGHAAYLAKFETPERVLMFSGPNDYSDFFMRPGNWIRTSGITGLNRHFSYLSLNDEAVDYAKQYSNINDLGLLQNDDSTLVDNLAAPFGSSHALYTEQTPGFVILNHNVPIKNSVKNREVWTYMLSTPILATTAEYQEAHFQIYPNPAQDFVMLENLPHAHRNVISVFDSHGREVMKLTNIRSSKLKVNLSQLPNGMYFVRSGTQTRRIVKI